MATALLTMSVPATVASGETVLQVLLSEVLLSGGSIIDLDGTIFIQLAIFLVLFLVLRAFVFEPMTKLFAAREKAIDGAREEARKLEREMREQTVGFEEKIRAARIAAAEERDRIRAEGAKVEKTILENVKNDTAKALDEARRRLATEATEVRGALQRAVPAMAREIAAKLLGRPLN
jgi:F-type H+-transporting ATPase subunit b